MSGTTSNEPYVHGSPEGVRSFSRPAPEQALRELRSASNHGDVAAMTKLGKHALVATDAPMSPEEGAEFIVRAANLGGAEAAAQLAVLAALGMHLQQDWQTALAAMCFAAEQGWPAAQGQLRVLASDRELAARQDVDSGDDPRLWARLAASIDLNRWHQSGDAVDLNSAPLVRRFPAFAPASVCRWMIERARGRLARALVFDAATGQQRVSAERTNSWAPFNVTQADLVSVLIQARMCASAGTPFRYLEPLTVLQYQVGERSTEHYDFVDPHTPAYEAEMAVKGQRVLTFLLYLNDDYGGGETEFVDLRIAHRGRQGEGLFFVNALENGEPDLRSLHAGRPPTSGEKWVVSQFVRNRPSF